MTELTTKARTEIIVKDAIAVPCDTQGCDAPRNSTKSRFCKPCRYENRLKASRKRGKRLCAGAKSKGVAVINYVEPRKVQLRERPPCDPKPRELTGIVAPRSYIASVVASKRSCSYGDCNALTEGRYCEEHVREAFPRDMTPVRSGSYSRTTIGAMP